MPLALLPYFEQPTWNLGRFSAFGLGLFLVGAALVTLAAGGGLRRGFRIGLGAAGAGGAALALLAAPLGLADADAERVYYPAFLLLWLVAGLPAFLPVARVFTGTPERREGRIAWIALGLGAALLPRYGIDAVGPVVFHAFGLLVMGAILVGLTLVPYRARVVGLDEALAASLVWWLGVGGLAGSHVFEVLWYRPEAALADPAILLRFWEGISSFGGILSGFLIIGYWVWRQPEFRRRLGGYLDCCAWSWPFLWVFGRAGCTSAHDHVGRMTDFALGIDFPAGALGFGSPAGRRHDLGLYELLIFLALVPVWLWLSRRPRPFGWWMPRLMLFYGVIRWPLDALRDFDRRYLDAAWTPAQFGSAALAAVGLVWIIAQRRVWAERPPERELPWRGPFGWFAVPSGTTAEPPREGPSLTLPARSGAAASDPHGPTAP